MFSITCSRFLLTDSASRCTRSMRLRRRSANCVPRRGSIHALSADPLAPPRIAPNYLSTDLDRKVAADALRLTRRIAAAPALAPFNPREVLPGLEFQSEEELQFAAGNVGTTIFHPVGTCRMGRIEDSDAVVDSRLRVIGVTGLRVVDASIMPTITSGNTNSPTLMIAERASDMIREDWANARNTALVRNSAVPVS